MSRWRICDGAGRPPKPGTRYTTPKSDRGECRECAGDYQVTRFGFMRAHRDQDLDE